MLCPKCKTSIPNNTLRCPKCNLKVRIVCPKCKSVSLMGKKFCSECGYSFFKKCPECGTINLATAQYCRKCGSGFEKKENIQEKIISPQIVETVEEPIIEPSDLKEVIQKPVDTVQESITTEQETIVESVESINKNGSSEFDTIEIVENNEETIVLDEPVLVDEPDLNHVDASSVKEEQPLEEYIVSSDEIEMSETQLKTILDKVTELDKTINEKNESEELIQKKFEKQEEIEQEKEEIIPPEYMQLNQQDAQTTIVDAIQNPLKRIISLNGKEGYGKSLILRYVREALREENYIWAWGECNALTQITPFGYIQDVLLNLFNLSNFSVNIEDFISNNTKALESQFFNLNSREINDLINFLYPIKKAEFNGILKRKEYTFHILKKVFENFSMKSSIIFVVDDFENIDGASYDFLKNILDDAKFSEKVKIVITNKHNKIAQGYFYGKEFKHNNYSNIFLSGADRNQCVGLVNTLLGIPIDLPETIENQLFENSKGTSVYVEQVCLLLYEIGAIIRDEDGAIVYNHNFDDYILPHNTYRIVEERLALIESEYPVVVKSLYFASILGNKFSIHQFENVLQFLKITKDDFSLICNYLVEKNFIYQFSENFFVFNNTLIWHYIYERAKADKDFVEFNKNIYTSVLPLTLSNHSLKPLLLQNFEDKESAFEQWGVNADLASYLGDTNLYVISLKQKLKLSNDVPGVISAQEKISIFEKMGKILYKLSPKEAINYLSAAIAYYKDEANYNPIRVVELSAFLTKACVKSGDFLGIIEACDVALNSLPAESYEVEKAIINSKKLDALLYLGNCEEVVNLTNTELMETMENALAKSNSSEIISDKNIFKAWVDTSLNLATAYAIQGNKKVFETLSKIDDAIVSNEVDNKITYEMKILLTKALAHSMRGEAKLSSEILSEITSKYSTEQMEENYILKWNFINIINKIVSKDYHNIVDEMFQITTFADNINDMFIKNLLKLLLGYIIQVKSKNLNKANEIYNEEIIFFSKEKIATGALLSWYLIANASIATQGVDFALDIAIKALDVAKGPKINNYIFIVALKLLIAEIFMIKQDFEAVKMYLEKAMKIAKANDFRFSQMLICHAFGKYNEEMISIYPDNAQAYAQAVIDMYQTALKLAKMLVLSEYETTIRKDIVSFKAFCHLKNITVVIDED